MHATTGSDEMPLHEVNQAHPMQISTDGAGTVFGGQARQDRLVVEIMDPGRKTIGSTSLAEMGVDEDAAIQEVQSTGLVCHHLQFCFVICVCSNLRAGYQTAEASVCDGMYVMAWHGMYCCFA